ncbi:MAG: amidohydrolase family protein [Acidimicrobiia bacterium]|nr:amidohydrolase family protein [Acidimicrobiia bacterium]
MIDLLVTAGTVVTVDKDRRVIANGAVAVDGGRIVDVDPADEVVTEARETIDMPHGVVMPGLIDSHGHAGHSLIRTMADDLGAWMDACERVYLHGATADFWRAEARLTALERLMAGTTTSLSMLGGAGDTVRADDPSHGNAHLMGYADVGLRAVVAVGPGAPPFPKLTTSHDGDASTEVASSFADQMAVVASLVGEWRGHARCSVALTYPTLPMAAVGDAPDAELVAGAAAVRSLSDEAGLLIVQDGHQSDTVEASSRLGLLGPRTVLSHAVDLDDGHIELIAASGTSIAHNPSAIYSQFGRCPVLELMAAGATVGLGSDATAPDRSADMFRHMFQLTRYHRADRRDPALFPPGTTLELATIGSATALGMGDELGSIEVGKAADIILVDADKAHLTPFTHPVHQIVYFATGADVDTVIVAGDVLMRGRRVETVEMGEVLEEARRQQSLAYARVGLEPATQRPGLWGAVRYPDGPGLEFE